MPEDTAKQKSNMDETASEELLEKGKGLPRENGSVLLITGDIHLAETLERELRLQGYACEICEDCKSGLHALTQGDFDVALIDLEPPGDKGFQLLKTIYNKKLGAIPLILAAPGNMPNVLHAIQLGAFDYVEKPCNSDLLIDKVNLAEEYHELMQHGDDSLKLSEKRYKLLFESSIDAIVTVEPPSWRFTSANPAAMALFGFSKESDFTSVNPADVSPEYQPDGRSSKEEARRFIETALRDGKCFFDWRHKRRDGSEFPASVLLTRVALGKSVLLQATVRDITEQRRAEEALRQSEETFRIMTDAAQDAILIMDPNGCIRFYNQAAEALFGWPAEEAIGKDMLSLLAPKQDRTLYEMEFELFMRSANGSEAKKTLELSVTRKDGSEFPIDMSISGAQLRGARHAICIIRDISERKQEEEELNKVHTELKRLVEEYASDLIQINESMQKEISERRRAENELRQVNRILRTISECNQAIVRTKNESELLQKACSIIVDSGEYPLAWIGLTAQENLDILRPMAWVGFESCSPIEWKITRDSPNTAGGITNTAILLKEPQIDNNILEHPEQDPWRNEAIQLGCTSHAALPLCVGDSVIGVLNAFSRNAHSFSPTEMDLLQDLVYDLGNAIASLREREERKRVQGEIVWLSALKEQLLDTAPLEEKLKRITDVAVETFRADSVRIWIVGNGDLCDGGCIHATATEGPDMCRVRTHCLHLMAKSGHYEHIEHKHKRIPLGNHAIGRIATGEIAPFLTNDITHDPRICNQAWAEKMGLASFAGWRLLSPQGRLIGVMALFSKKTISRDEQRLLADLSNTTTHVIHTGMATHALEESESKLQAILHGCPIPQFAIDREHHVISWNNPLEQMSGITEKEILGSTKHWAAFYKQEQPCLVDLLVDGAIDQIPKWYGNQCVPSSLIKDAYESEGLYTTNLNEARWLHFTAAVIRDAQGVVIGGVETLDDITEDKRTEEELRKSRDELEVRIQERTCELSETNASLLSEVEHRKETEMALRRAHTEAERLLASMSSFLIGLDAELRINRWNAAAERTFGLPAERMIGRYIAACGISWDLDLSTEHIQHWPTLDKSLRIPEVRFHKPDGSDRFLGITINPIRDEFDAPEGCFLLGIDITERRILETQLVQAQKLESIGQLAAGIAHEINTPTQYVGDNIEFLQTAFESLNDLAQVFQNLVTEAGKGHVPKECAAKIENALEEAHLDFLAEQVPRAISQSLEGVERIASIVLAMKEFSHPGTAEKVSVDLNQCIKSTITVSRNEWKYVANVTTDLQPNLPPIPGLPAELNQVILNMIVNAAHAISDVAANNENEKGEIAISTRLDGKWVEMRIRDTGSGIPEAIRERVFDPFFTTKEVGRGTGQGLAIAHNAIVDKHGGTITLESEIGRGTTFIVRLPVAG